MEKTRKNRFLKNDSGSQKNKEKKTFIKKFIKKKGKKKLFFESQGNKNFDFNKTREYGEKILTENLGLNKKEKVLVICDETTFLIGKAFHFAGKKLAKKSKLIEIKSLPFNGMEPNEIIAKEMLKFEVILMPVKSSLSHTKTRMHASKQGARIASMPRLNYEMIERDLKADYNKIKELSLKVKELFSKADLAEIKTELGTDIKVPLKGMKAGGSKAGFYLKPGQWGNIPQGEIYIVPEEGKAEGKFVVDASMGTIGKIINPIEITVKKGFVSKIEGKEEAEKLRKLIKPLGKNARNIAEFAIGTNDTAKIIGVVLEDEKVLGTAHLAIGNNTSMQGGTTYSEIHLDGVFTKPTIWLDGKLFMEKGKILI
ncbi:MAG: leucyl aminopeptidase [Candidatus Diapherotrites archaeon CG10_big_fil_rev_8_21_14_0_10_31_34]|nr:MAG: leucyl aminopeptidase [Candidatus Diapherotrites archaeon CG10_big_fil_rev_8_21_14_0_10_31_34]